MTEEIDRMQMNHLMTIIEKVWKQIILPIPTQIGEAKLLKTEN